MYFFPLLISSLKALALIHQIYFMKSYVDSFCLAYVVAKSSVISDLSNLKLMPQRCITQLRVSLSSYDHHYPAVWFHFITIQHRSKIFYVCDFLRLNPTQNCFLSFWYAAVYLVGYSVTISIALISSVHSFHFYLLDTVLYCLLVISDID